MKIVIDGRMWAETGPGRYIRNLLINLQHLDRQNNYQVLLLKKDLGGFEETANFRKVEVNLRWYTVSEQLKLPKLLNTLKPDLVHFPMFNVPVLYKGKYVVTVHDLIHEHFQMQISTAHGPLIYAFKKAGYKVSFSRAVSKSVKIITPSQFVRNQLVKEWNILEDKITVAYEGVDDSLLTLSKKVNSSDFNLIQKKFSLNSSFLFYVGNAHPHKNLPFLIELFKKIKMVRPELSLVLSGPNSHFWQELKKRYVSEELIFTGFISERELVTLYKNAQAYILPSLEEGFGLPILEAMACDCPVVSSNAGSLPEVGGKACLYFDPHDQRQALEKILMVLGDEKVRAKLIKNGKERYKKFSWEKMAKETLKIYQQCE